MLLRQLFEAIDRTGQGNTAVMGWGRGMGHKGHMLLARAVLHHAQEMDAKAYFVVSRTSLVDPATGQPWADKPTFTKTKDDPLTPEEKLATYRKVFPQNAEVFSVASADASTLDKVLAKIAGDGFSKVILIVGELEKDSFSFLTRPDKSGVPPYQRAGLKDLEIISRQDTKAPGSDPTAPDYQQGPRATPMRAVLTDPSKSEEEQFAVWRDAMPDNLSDDEVMDLMNKAKQRMAAVPAAKNAKKVKQAVAEGTTVTRIDSKPITDFLSSLKAYKHTDDWSQSGVDTGDDSYWKNKNLKTNTTKGLFAGDPRRTALYATGNAHETRYVEFTQDGQPIVYFDRKDLPAMRSRKTYLTVFDASDFRQLPTGEWFSKNPSKPIKQVPIGDPFKYIASQGWIVRVTDDLDKVFKQVKNMHKAGKIAQYGAEGMNESKQGVAEVSLDEGPSLPSTLKSIATNGEPITQLYGKLQAMAKRWVDNNGSLKGFHRNAAGQSAQWFNNFYFNKLQAELYALTKQAPRHAAPLIVFLKDASEDRERHINFTEISRSLPPILFRMGKKINDESLARFAASWDSRRKEYESYLATLEDQADSEDDFDDPVVKPEKSKMPGQQNAQAEQIVNDILSKLPKNVAGDIRNAIARAPNKLQALQQELSKRKIQGVAEATSAAVRMQRAWERQQAKSAASRKRGEELLNPKKKEEPNFSDKDDEEKISKQGVAK